MHMSRLLSFSSNSPSFGSFSSAADLASIAARVVEEFREQELRSDLSHDEDDFDFAFDCPSRNCSHHIATADEIFSNGQILPLNPYAVESQLSPPKSTLTRRRRPALRKLFSEDRHSSSEAEEDLTGVPPESYCVWKPKQSISGGDDDLQGLSSSPSHNKIKSNSAGLSKRWKLRNILHARSSSEGNDKLVFPAPVKNSDETNSVQKEEETPSKDGVRESEETKRQTYVPYKKDMIGIIKNVNGLSRHLRPF